MSNPPNLYGLIIGIDDYSAGSEERLDTEGNLVTYENLRGCVGDALAVEQYLLGPGNVDKGRIVKLLAPPPGRTLSEEERMVPKPTYKAIVKALHTLLKEAESGDIVYIHYSGHGARATTVFPEIKSEGKWDEALVPCDIRSGGRYLRDLELGLMLHKMAKKGLKVTAVLDCCHSGEGVRGTKERSIRAARGHYRSNLPVDVPDTVNEILENKSVMLDEPAGFSLMTACLPDQQTEEIQLPSGRWCGIFTHSLLSTLTHGVSSITSPRAIYDNVCARVYDEFPTQTPHFLGETTRFFSHEGVGIELPAITIRRLCQGLEFADQVELSGGHSHGVVEGSEYAVIPFGANHVPEHPMRLLVEAIMPVYSVASICTDDDKARENVMLGCHAVRLSVPLKIGCGVGLSPELAADHTAFIQEWEENCGDDNWLELVRGEKDKPLTFQISQDQEGHYQIQDGHGTPWPNIAPPLPAVEAGHPLAAQTILSRLRHLARFLAVKKICNPSLTSNLRGKITFEISPHGSDPPLKNVGGEYYLRNGQKFDLHVKNCSSDPVAFVLLNLQPLYAIEQVYPYRGAFDCLDPDHSKHMEGYDMYIPPALEQSAKDSPTLDILKLFVTSRGTSFDCLKMGSIVRASRAGRPDSTNMIELLRQMSNARHVRSPDGDHDDWQVVEIRVRTEP